MFPVGIEAACFGGKNGGGEIGSETSRFGHPTMRDTFRAHDERTERFVFGFGFCGFFGFFCAELEHPGQRLNGFTQAHVIG